MGTGRHLACRCGRPHQPRFLSRSQLFEAHTILFLPNHPARETATRPAGARTSWRCARAQHAKMARHGAAIGASPVCMSAPGHAHDRNFELRGYPPRSCCSACACRAGSRCLGDCLATKITYVACGYRPCSFRSGSVGGPGASSLGVLQRDRRHAEGVAVFRRRRSRFRTENERDRCLLSSAFEAEGRIALPRLQ